MPSPSSTCPGRPWPCWREKGSREKFAAIDRWLRGSGCDAAILGCTELSVYRTYHGLPDYYLDAMEILAERCITACGYKLRMV